MIDDENLLEAFNKDANTLNKLFFVETKIRKRKNTDNYDSRSGLEDIIREELRKRALIGTQ